MGVTGSIAAYKSAYLIRELIKYGAEVRVVMTEAASNFITDLTLATLSRTTVVREMFPESPSQGTWHIDLAGWGDVMIIAPASANTIAKIACGLADNALTALVLALRCPLLVAPAMDVDMYHHPATQRNLELLEQRDVRIIPPESGELASGLQGEGRLADLPALIAAIGLAVGVEADLAGKSILVTAGPTYEDIDPVRFLGNRSTGKMGFALATAASRRGAQVTLISGPSNISTPPGVERIDVRTAEEMFEAVKAAANGLDVAIMAAAVADFTPVEASLHKLKKSPDSTETLTLQLRRTPDILSWLGKQNRPRVLVGFAVETKDMIDEARRKLREKNADLIVVNNPLEEVSAFAADTNKVIFVTEREVKNFERQSKARVADHILDFIVKKLADPESLGTWV